MDQFTIPKLWDMHVHLRDGEMLKAITPFTARHFYRAVVMPNLTPPVRAAADVSAYYERIMNAAGPDSNFNPLMTFKIMPDTEPKSIESLAALDYLVAGKVYPKNLTTNAQDGVDDFLALRDVYLAMQKNNLVLCLHGEMPGDHIMGRNREQEFLRILWFLARTYPDLRIVMEHITTAAAVDAILDLPDNVAATITVHHLLLTHDDVGGDRLCPNNFCKPIAKDPADREALIQAATSGCPKFFFGSDSAPHPKEGKQRLYDCCAGIFTSPVALGLLADIFEKSNALDRFEMFVRNFGAQFYGISEPLEDPPRKLRFIKHPWLVPDEFAGIVPFWTKQTINWKVENSTN